tara:strand:+ start:2365 stop:2589 length:225 start_codon:yes stop_codon:yes gene_type:complete
MNKDYIKPDFSITIEENRSALWQRLRAYLEDELATARERNDRTSNTDTETWIIRGDIKRLKELLNLDREARGDE